MNNVIANALSELEGKTESEKKQMCVEQSVSFCLKNGYDLVDSLSKARCRRDMFACAGLTGLLAYSPRSMFVLPLEQMCSEIIKSADEMIRQLDSEPESAGRDD